MPTRPVTDADQAQQQRTGFGIYVALVPWVLFTLITQRVGLQAAALAALAAAVVIAVPSLTAGHPKVLELGAILAFVGFTVVAFTADPATSAWVARYARAMAAGVLAVISFGSLLRTPFTEQYARESVPRQFWSSSRFQETNRRLTLMWGWVFVATIPSHLIAGAINTPRANTIFNWVIPIGLIIWAAKRTAAARNREGELTR